MKILNDIRGEVGSDHPYYKLFLYYLAVIEGKHEKIDKTQYLIDTNTLITSIKNMETTDYSAFVIEFINDVLRLII